MRQLPAPGRTAALFAAALAALASAGCMSVGDDDVRKPKPSTSAERTGAAEGQDTGGGGVPGGPQGSHHDGTGRTGGTADRDEDGDDKKAEDGKPTEDSGGTRATPNPSAGPTSGPAPGPGGGGGKPEPRPTPPPEGPGEPAPPTPPVDPAPEPPEPTPTPPVDPTPQPSASSAPEVHGGALRAMRDLEPERVHGTEPVASPQAGPA
ncbi:hypothetical protein [Streptomyces sp. NPDC005805]|uniref:hypothetical protein n=1 Tax=Streptomyces sp. NPDC005805 TaxID=3157068 RepID=UPI0034082BB2